MYVKCMAEFTQMCDESVIGTKPLAHRCLIVCSKTKPSQTHYECMGSVRTFPFAAQNIFTVRQKKIAICNVFHLLSNCEYHLPLNNHPWYLSLFHWFSSIYFIDEFVSIIRLCSLHFHFVACDRCVMYAFVAHSAISSTKVESISFQLLDLVVAFFPDSWQCYYIDVANAFVAGCTEELEIFKTKYPKKRHNTQNNNNNRSREIRELSDPELWL